MKLSKLDVNILRHSYYKHTWPGSNMSDRYSENWVKSALALMFTLLVSSAAAQNAQTLNLFEPVERQAQPGYEQILSVPSSTVAPSNTEPFTLIGTSRMGSRWRAMVRSPSGVVVSVDLDPSVPVVIPGYPGYRVSATNARELVVLHPASSPCVERTDKGVRCTSGTEARLSIATASPLAPAPQPVATADNAAVTTSEPMASEVPSDNPFAAALRAARERAESEGMPLEVMEVMEVMEGERFRPRRIDPSDVPPGARLIRTPFGDRIITE